ncbi:ribonuclease R [Sulfobacillus sp. DSM 109850]|uniref:Ribonuclease R n=2 Tax=Sulfobacillus harzensis TaxID=2729629 RepID=A0A7Y0L1H1_9FIRM|nr:ribonuclease R [Sulfobacillus harzensis]
MPEAQVASRLAGSKAPTKALYRSLSELRRDGWLVRDFEGRLTVSTRVGALRVNPRGFGFVVSADYPGDDVFVPQRHLLSAAHEDRVLVWVRRVAQSPGPEGRIMDVVERAHTHVVGRLDHAGRSGGWRVIPRDMRQPLVWVSRPRDKNWHSGLIVTCRITDWPLDPKRPVRGEVEEILGEADAPGVDIRALMVDRHLSPRFPPEVEREAALLPGEVREADMVGRADLRSRFIVTIDGSDAKDLDDAISVERVGDGYRVGVHIADVSYYVREGSALDLEARRRGTSVYLVDRVIPMLPERLSNGIASLNPAIPRLTVTAWMDLDSRGRRTGARFTRSVIQTRHRLTYDFVNQVLAGTEKADEDLTQFLHLAEEVRQHLKAIRVQRGAVDFDLPEAKVVLNAAGHPVDIVPRSRGLAESIIEELMLLANEAVAGELIRYQLPGLFRVHDEPGDDKMDQFRELIGALGYRLPNPVTPKSLQSLLNEVKGRPEERVINSALLRSMKQARYGPVNTGHFGLASEEYTHFTSPIRRYPDLWVHRVLTQYLGQGLTSEDRERLELIVAEVGESSSAREREAMEAERDSVQMKEAEYMRDHLGEEYHGVISGVANFGIFVELPNLVEGLVRLEDLPADHWSFDPIHYRLTGDRTGRVFQLGQEVDVVVAAVDVPLRRIDFQLKLPAAPPQKKKRARRRR